MLRYVTIFVIIASFYIYDASCQLPVNQQCMACLCQAISGCKETKTCGGDYCGAFKMTKPYWIDGGQQTLNGEDKNSTTAFSNCANDVYCSALTVQGYMAKYEKDCNGDGKIDCDDFATIHERGGNGCVGATIPEAFNERYQECKRIIGGKQ